MEENNTAVTVESTEATAEVEEAPVESETTADESPSSEQEPTSTGSDENEELASSEEDSEESGDELSSLSPKGQNRFQRLANENRRLRERLGEGMYAAATTEGQKPGAIESSLPWANQSVSEPREITEEQYKQDIAAEADKVVQERIAQYERQQRLKDDVRTLESTYDELNPDSEAYNKDLSDLLAKQFLDVRKGNPDASLSEYVENIMSLRERGREEGKSEVSGKILKQAAQQAVAPAGDTTSTEGSLEEELIKQRKEGKITFEEFERRIEELGK